MTDRYPYCKCKIDISQELDELRGPLAEARTLLYAASALPRPANVVIDFETTIRAIDAALKDTKP
jgi:hypothetical protein